MRNQHAKPDVSEARERRKVEEFNKQFERGSAVVMSANSQAPGRPGFVMGPAELVTLTLSMVQIAGMGWVRTDDVLPSKDESLDVDRDE